MWLFCFISPDSDLCSPCSHEPSCIWMGSKMGQSIRSIWHEISLICLQVFWNCTDLLYMQRTSQLCDRQTHSNSESEYAWWYVKKHIALSPYFLRWEPLRSFDQPLLQRYRSGWLSAPCRVDLVRSFLLQSYCCLLFDFSHHTMACSDHLHYLRAYALSTTSMS